MLGLRGICRASCDDCHDCRRRQLTAAEGGSAAAGEAAAAATGGAGAGGVAAGGRDNQGSRRTVWARDEAEYSECLFSNMHSLRQAWSGKAQGAGVRAARNAIRRDMRTQQQ